MKKLCVLAMLVLPAIILAQKTYSTKSASIKFFSHTPAEDIEANNRQVLCTLNDKTGQLSFTALVKGFKFENALMQEHFNGKDYMYSSKYPKATFTGTITNIASVNFTKSGTYKVTASGTLTIHGVSQKITEPGTITVAGNKVSLKALFKVKPKNYGVKAPEEIAETLDITVNASF